MNKAFLKRLYSARYLSSRAAHNLAFSFFTNVTCFDLLQNESETRLMQLNSWPDIFKDLFLVKRLRFSRATLFWAGGDYNRPFPKVKRFCERISEKDDFGAPASVRGSNRAIKSWKMEDPGRSRRSARVVSPA